MAPPLRRHAVSASARAAQTSDSHITVVVTVLEGGQLQISADKISSRVTVLEGQRISTNEETEERVSRGNGIPQREASVSLPKAHTAVNAYCSPEHGFIRARKG